MKVGLFAPDLRAEFGGVWQFSQWITSRVGRHIPMHLALPDALLDELRASEGMPSTATATSMREIRLTLNRHLVYRILGAPVEFGALGAWAPRYHRATQRLQRRLVGATMEAVAALNDMKTHGVDILHIPIQHLSDPAAGRRYPYVINPHDYQHEHFPELFTRRQLRDRRVEWYASQRAARAIVVHSLQTRDDAIKYLGVPEERVFYAPYGPLETFKDVDETTARRIVEGLSLPEHFIFYPARMWAHKNHVTLLEALGFLKKKRGLQVACVFTDAGGPHSGAIAAAVGDLGLGEQVTTLGRVSSEMMSALYRLCGMVVVPSLFEQNSGPMLEAIQFGKAIAVSNLPELVNSLGDGGLVFDPRSSKAIADAIEETFSSPARRAALENRARARRRQLSWTPFVETYRTAYAYAAGNG